MTAGYIINTHKDNRLKKEKNKNLLSHNLMRRGKKRPEEKI